MTHYYNKDQYYEIVTKETVWNSVVCGRAVATSSCDAIFHSNGMMSTSVLGGVRNKVTSCWNHQITPHHNNGDLLNTSIISSYIYTFLRKTTLIDKWESLGKCTSILLGLFDNYFMLTRSVRTTSACNLCPLQVCRNFHYSTATLLPLFNFQFSSATFAISPNNLKLMAKSENFCNKSKIACQSLLLILITHHTMGPIVCPIVW